MNAPFSISSATQRHVDLLAEMTAAYDAMLETASRIETNEFDIAAARFRAAREAVDAHKRMGETL